MGVHAQKIHTCAPKFTAGLVKNWYKAHRDHKNDSGDGKVDFY